MARAGPAALRCGSFLKESRKRAGLSLLEAGQRIGISVGIIKAWENGDDLLTALDQTWTDRLIAVYKLDESGASKLRHLRREYATESIHGVPKTSVTDRLRNWISPQTEDKSSRGAPQPQAPVVTATRARPPAPTRHREAERPVPPPKQAVPVPRPIASGIFISYRRSDQAALAGRIYDKLEAKFGKSQVFMDVDSIDLGVDFVEVLNDTLRRCKALIVVIGKDWLSAQDDNGQRRLDSPDDYVRLEIEAALRRDIRVIPILVDGTSIPRAAELPESLTPLVRRNGRDISNARFNSDCGQLIKTLSKILKS